MEIIQKKIHLTISKELPQNKVKFVMIKSIVNNNITLCMMESAMALVTGHMSDETSPLKVGRHETI